MNPKSKVLFVVNDFFQAGAQRYAYEVDNAINKQLFKVEILCLNSINSSKEWEDYYYNKHKVLGSKIIFLKKFVAYELFKNKYIAKFVNKICKGKVKVKNPILIKHFNRFDVIIWFGEYILAELIHNLDEKQISKSIIILMSAKFQGWHIYNMYPKNYKYNFISGFSDKKQVNYELSDFINYDHLYLPLAINFNAEKNEFNFNEHLIKKIGIFTRFSVDKPLDTFLYAFHLLLIKFPNVQLHLYGNGDAEKIGLPRMITNLGLNRFVFFRGHQANLMKTAKDDNLDLVWFQGYINRPAGYAGFDICTTGIPQVLWDFSSSNQLENNNSTYPIHKNLINFVDDSYRVLTDKFYAEELSKKQFEDVINNRNMKFWILQLENKILNISNKKGS